MKIKILRIAPVLFVMVLTLAACSGNKQKAEEPVVSNELSGDALVQRGKYLVTSMGCHDCHSPKKMGPAGPEIIPELMLSGFQADGPAMISDPDLAAKGFGIFNPDLTAAAGPWGISYAANLTPDASGIGNWTEEQFRRALKEGKFKGIEGSRTLLPPMPWQNFVNLEDQDVKAIFAYLQSIPPVHNIVPAPVPPQGN